MVTTFFRWLHWCAPVCLAFLTACGGGGGGGSDTDSAPVAPSITTQPDSVTVGDGQSASFSVAATGSGPLRYQWRRNGTDIVGATNASYTMTATSAADNGAQFTVVVSNSAGSVTSNPATLTRGAPIAPSVTTQPLDASVVAPATATFNVVAGGTTPLTHQWYRNGAAIVGATGASYTTPATSAGDSDAVFAVVVSNAAGSVTSRSATLTVAAAVTAPTIQVGPRNATVNTGQTASFDVSALGTPRVFTYQWRRDGADILGATSAAYTTPPAVAADHGARFSVVVSNSAGSATSAAATLSVVDSFIAPTILAQPQSATVLDGFNASFVVAASGSAPLAYQWRKNGVDIPSANSMIYMTPVTTLADNGALFSVVISNPAGMITSQAALLTVTSAAPAIATGPTAQAVIAPTTATFNVVATGSLPLAYQWRRNGADIAGATAASYTTPATAVSDSGALFSVVVSNAAGSAMSSNAGLTVTAAPATNVPPAILAQPQSLAVPPGAVATFSVAAAGSAPLTYQWRKNGVDIAGATSASYTSPAASSVGNGAVFTVIVQNAAGSATSTAAVLTLTIASAFPERAVTLIVPFAAGGATDVLARDLREALVADQGWTVVISNVAGAGGTTGMTRAATAAADGYTLLVGSTEMATAPSLYRTLMVNPVTDFAHLGLLDETPSVLTGRLGLPAGNYATLASWLDGQPAGSFKFADSGLGTQSHLCALMFANRDGTTFAKIRYPGTAPAVTDLLGGQIDLYCDSTISLGPQIEAGRARAYGVTSTRRSIAPALAGLSTLDESGLPGFDVTRWHGLYAPAGTPPEVVARLNAALRTALVNPEFARRQAARGARIVDGARLTPDGSRQFIQDETGKWRPLIQAAGEYAD